MNILTSETRNQIRPKVAVVVGSGGIKSLAAIALFEFLNQAQIKIDLMVGCSGGALICALLGAGYRPAQCRDLVAQFLDRKLFSQFDYRSILRLASSRLGRFGKDVGMFKPQALQNVYCQVFGDLRLENLHPKTILQTTDVNTGEGVVLSRGPVRDAVYASCAFFPTLPPLWMEDRWLADGVYSAPVPVLEAVRRNVDVIIALDFKQRFADEPRRFLDCFRNCIDTTLRSLAHSQMGLAVQIHHNEIIKMTVEFERSINVRDAHEASYILEMGERAIAHYKEDIVSAVNNFSNRKGAVSLQRAAAG